MNGNCGASNGLKLFGIAVVLIGGTALVTRQVVRADDPPKAGEKAAGGHEMSAEEKAMMEKMTAMMTPGPNHKALDAFVGDWNVDGKFWEKPGGEGTPSKATASYKWIMDGRFIIEDYNSEMMGQPFKGTNIIGYNNASKQYQSIWFDSMGTGIWTSTGSMEGKTLTTEGKDIDCMTGKLCNSKMVMKVVDSGKVHMEMFKDGPDGKPFKCMEFNYTRK